MQSSSEKYTRTAHLRSTEANGAGKEPDEKRAGAIHVARCWSYSDEACYSAADDSCWDRTLSLVTVVMVVIVVI